METQGSYWQYCATPQWEPSINICEHADAYYVSAELAGMRREDIDVQIHGERLVLRGQRPVPKPDAHSTQTSIHHMEIEHGPFCREIDLPDDVDMHGISARYKDGLLWIRLAKHTEQTQP